MLDADVVAGGVSVRAGDAHAAGGSAGHETELSPLAALFAAGDGTSAFAFHVITPGSRKRKGAA
jgi:hypothetical protein